MLKPMQKIRDHRLLVFVSGLLLVCTLLSACSSPFGGSARTTSGSGSAGSTPTLIPSPTVTVALQQQGAAQLQTFQQWISLMQQYNGKVDKYQQQYTGDQQALSAATTDALYQTALATLNGHVKAIKLPALKTEAVSLQSKLSQEANAWSNSHTYHDNYDGVTYNLGYEYQGIVNYPAQGLLDTSTTITDYQYIIGQLNVWLANFDAYKANFTDNTPWNQAHATDTRLLNKYGYTSGVVLVVSFSEQALRVYKDGKLINAFQVVTGQPGHPSLPGTWWIEQHQKDTKFTSGKKPGQEGYYPDTPIAFALLYHSGGYFFHQSWWRSMYGKNLQFPHSDPGGTSFAEHGSHGCVNMSTDSVSWLYYNAPDGTKIIMY